MPDHERWRAVVETAVDAIITIDDHAIVETVNPAAERLFGYAADEVIGRNVSLLMPGQEAAAHDGYIARYLAEGAPRIIGTGREVTGRHRDGEEIALHLSVGEMHFEGRLSFVGILRDIRPANALRAELRARADQSESILAAMSEGLVLHAGDGAIVSANAAAERILGLTVDQMAGRTSRDTRWRAIREDGSLWPGDEHPAMVTLRTGEPRIGVIMGIDRPDATRVWIEITTAATVLTEAGGTGVVAVFSDVTQRRQDERALAESERKFRLLAENSSDLILRVRASGEIVYASSAATRFGHDPSDLVGRHLSGLLEPDEAPLDETAARINASHEPTTLEGRLLRGDGAWEPYEATVRPIRDASGHVVERQAAIRSIALRRRQELEIAESLARYQALARSIPGGAVFLFDRDMRYLLAEGPAVMALTDGADPTGKLPSEIFSEEVATRVDDLYRSALDGSTRTFRTSARDGRIYDVTITPTRSEGAVVGGMVLAIDVTEQAHVEGEQAALHEIAQAVAQGAEPEAVLALVVEKVGALFDAVGAAIFHYSGPDEAELLASAPTSPDELLPARSMPLDGGTAIGRVAMSGRPMVVADYGDADDDLVRALRARGAVGGAAAPITIDQRPWGALGFGGANAERLTPETAARLARFADLVATNLANVQALRTLSREASTDELTALPNRRAFVERLTTEISRARRSGDPLSLAILDIDHFKRINDTHGHLVGDQVLVAVARRVERETRGEEMVARIGGEEFALILPETDSAGGLAAAERIRVAIASEPMIGVGQVTVSLGIGELSPDDEVNDLMRRADGALYTAKEGGRNASCRMTDGATGGRASSSP